MNPFLDLPTLIAQYQLLGEQNNNAFKFPTSHPTVQNRDNSVSNVRLGTFTVDNKVYVIPTMVEGRQLQGREPLDIALKHGLQNYPAFDLLEDAERWIQENHSRVR